MGLNACQAAWVTSISTFIAEYGTESPKQPVPKQRYRFEHIVGRVLLDFVVHEDFIAVDSPFASDPGVEFLVEDAFLRQLVIYVMLRRNFVSSMLTVDFVHDILVIGIANRSAKCSHLPLQKAHSLTSLFELSEYQSYNYIFVIGPRKDR